MCVHSGGHRNKYTPACGVLVFCYIEFNAELTFDKRAAVLESLKKMVPKITIWSHAGVIRETFFIDVNVANLFLFL